MVSFINEHQGIYGVEPIGNIPPVEFEEIYYQSQKISAMVVGLN
jgi:hypothetical protein